MLKKIKNTIKEVYEGVRTVLTEYNSMHPTDYVKVLTVVAMILIIVPCIVAFAKPISVIVKCLCYSVALLIIVAPTTLFLRNLYHKSKQSATLPAYPVYFGHNGITWNVEKINEEFHEIEKCFQSCYFTYVNEQINIIEYYFCFLPKRELPVSYDLIRLIQRMGEKMAARNLQQYGISTIYENMVGCEIQGECLKLTFAKNENGLAYVASLQNGVYRNYHTPQYQADSDMGESWEDND